MSRPANPFTACHPPAEAGTGWRFLGIGELIRAGDQFWCVTLRKWMPATGLFQVVPARLRNRYRRREA